MNAQLRPPEGLQHDVPADTYHARVLGELSSSGMKQLLRSPAHYRHWVDAEDESTPSQLFGRAFHMALLEPEKFARTYREPPADAPRRPSVTQLNAKNPSAETVRAIEFWAQWDAAGLITLSREDADSIRKMIAAVHAHPWGKLLVTGGQAEVTVRWTDEATGLPCKLRADYFREVGGKRYVVDLKSCTNSSADEFRNAVGRYGYHLQHAHYCEGFRSIGLPLDNYILLAIESDAPHVCQPHVIDAQAEIEGYALRRQAAETMRRCLDSGRWPGYSDEITTISLPRYFLKATPQE